MEVKIDGKTYWYDNLARLQYLLYAKERENLFWGAPKNAGTEELKILIKQEEFKQYLTQSEELCK